MQPLNNTHQEDVSQFMVTCKQWDGETLLSTPVPSNLEELNTYKLRLKLCIEETFELFEAMLTPEAYLFNIFLTNLILKSNFYLTKI